MVAHPEPADTRIRLVLLGGLQVHPRGFPPGFRLERLLLLLEREPAKMRLVPLLPFRTPQKILQAPANLFQRHPATSAQPLGMFSPRITRANLLAGRISMLAVGFAGLCTLSAEVRAPS